MAAIPNSGAALAGAQAGSTAQFSSATPAGSPVVTCPAALHNAFPNVLTAQAAARAAQKEATLSAADRATLDTALKDAKSDEERAYITKAFAACHTPDECAAFGSKISGKDAQWMQNNLQLTGSTSGTGVQQQWSHSCNATTVEAVRGQMDPVYALKTHEDNPNFASVDPLNAMKDNPALAAEQRTMLTSTYSGAVTGPHAGVAEPRAMGALGSGRWADDLLNQQQASTGVKYATVLAPSDPVAAIDAGLATGAPVPIVIGNQPGEYTHYVLVTGASGGTPNSYTIHDPWEGQTVRRSAADIQSGNLNIAGSNEITAIESPTAVPSAPTGTAC